MSKRAKVQKAWALVDENGFIFATTMHTNQKMAWGCAETELFGRVGCYDEPAEFRKLAKAKGYSVKRIKLSVS